jgi:hypothetical protein
MADMWTSLATNWVSGIYAVIAIAGSCVLVRLLLVPAGWPRWLAWVRPVQLWIWHNWWALSLLGFVGTMAALWFRVQLPYLLDDDKLIASVQEVTREQMPEPVTVNPVPINLEFNERNERGTFTGQVRATLKAPIADPQGMARYCSALLADMAFPSWEGGDSGPGAKNFGYTEPEFKEWRREAVRAGLLESKGKQQGYRLTPRGEIAFARIGRLNLEEASYGV